MHDASDQHVTAAAQAAQGEEFISKMPAGYDTLVGQRGVNLSGGQKQRLAIARALIRQPAILILDDSTSAVDVETESRLQAELNRIMQDRTSFVVAQRISTVLNADKILVLEDGRLVAEGTHHDLIDPAWSIAKSTNHSLENPVMSPQPRPEIRLAPPGGARVPLAEAGAKDTRTTLIRLWGYLRRQRHYLGLVTLLVSIATLCTLALPYLVGVAIDRYISVGDLAGLARLVALMVGIALTYASATWGLTLLMNRVSQYTVRDLRRDLFAQPANAVAALLRPASAW